MKVARETDEHIWSFLKKLINSYIAYISVNASYFMERLDPVKSPFCLLLLKFGRTEVLTREEIHSAMKE